MDDDDFFVLGDSLERRDRFVGGGAKHDIGPTVEDEYVGSVKSRYTVRVTSERIVHNFNTKALGKPVAEAIIKVIRERIESISETAKPNTILARKAAIRALAAGKAWALKRYDGGRIGRKDPSGDRLFNDSGRMAASVTGNATSDEKGGGWRINVAANRLSPDTLDGHPGGEDALLQIWERLKQFVPELADPDLLLDSIPVRNAINESMDMLMRKASSETVDLELELLKQLVEGFEAIDEILSA